MSGFVKPLSRLGVCRFASYKKGQPLKILLVGYNGARNTGADARVVALTQQLEQALGAGKSELTVMTLDTDNVSGYFTPAVRLWHFTTFFLFSLLRACSTHHVAVLCEGSTLTPTFAEALCVFYCEAAGIMRRQGKPCIAYGSEVGKLSGWLARLSSDMCRDTYFMVRTDESLKNLQALGLKGHVGTDTAWTFDSSKGEQWARRQLMQAGWDGKQPLMGVAPLNPYCWPVRPSLWRWLKAVVTRDFSQQYDKFYFFSDTRERRQQFQRYLSAMTAATNQYAQAHGAFVVILGMEQLDARVCYQLEQHVDAPHWVCTSKTYNVFQMTGLLRQLSILLTSRYHASVLSMEQACPIVAVSIDARLNGVMREVGLDEHYLHHADDADLERHIISSLKMVDDHQQDIKLQIERQLANYKNKTMAMSQFFTTWLTKQYL
jgi:polysaccharide pyruvyl transferase WcaK-like protein